jgi:Flp pilus assembly protein TadD
VLPPWKIILGLFGIVALVLIVAELQKAPAGPPRMTPSTASVENQAANMEALQHLKELEDQVKANPNDYKLLLDLANHLHDNRFWDKAIASYKKYLTKNPKDANARVDFGICYKENGDLASAKREMESVLKDEPNHMNAKFNLGIVALASGDLETSNDWFKKVVAQDGQSEVGQRAKQLLAQHNPQTLNN